MDINPKVIAVHWSIFCLCIRFISHAAVYANPFNGIVSESLCRMEYNSNSYQPKERRVDTDLTLELTPSTFSGPCKQLLEAPPSHGLYVRVYPVSVGEGRKHQYSTSGASMKNMNVEERRTRNTTSVGSCPLNIYQPSVKSSPPWRFDPCQLNGGEEAKLLSSPLRIVWQHGQNWPNYRITITAYGKDEVCEQEGRHSCLKLDQQKLVCIAEDLLCNGVQNCPSGIEFESDESPAACEFMEKKKGRWYIYIQDLLKNHILTSFGGLRTTVANGTANASGETSGSSTEHVQATSFTLTRSDLNKTIFVKTVIDSSSNIRKNFPKGLSKYGPWGYLMLGMLLCGGALLVCGLWECCCRKQKPVAPLTAGSLEQQPQQVMDANVISNTFAAMQQNRSHSLQAVINYDETEPPPSYAVLFPNQKSTEDLTQIATSSGHQRPVSVAE